MTLGDGRDDTVDLSTKVAYGFGALGKDFACSIIYIFLMFYYTDVAGLPAAFVGSLFLVARVVDAVTDPMMGVLVDNTRSRYGKFRPWIVIGTLVNSLALIAVFSTHLFSGSALYVYAAITYILWGITYTIMDIPIGRWYPRCPAVDRSASDWLYGHESSRASPDVDGRVWAVGGGEHGWRCIRGRGFFTSLLPSLCPLLPVP